MAIESIVYNEGFKIKLQWMAGVRGTVIYSTAAGDGLANDIELMEAVQRGGLQRFNGFSYGSGTTAVSYAPQQAALHACWVDICFCDYDAEFNVLRHEYAGTYFNGMCKVGTHIKLIPISSDRQAVELTVQNKSKFAIEPNGIGYSVNGRIFPIPVAFEKNERKVLPQFDVGMDDTVKLCRIEGSYPAEFFNISTEHS